MKAAAIKRLRELLPATAAPAASASAAAAAVPAGAHAAAASSAAAAASAAPAVAAPAAPAAPAPAPSSAAAAVADAAAPHEDSDDVEFDEDEDEDEVPSLGRRFFLEAGFKINNVELCAVAEQFRLLAQTNIPTHFMKRWDALETAEIGDNRWKTAQETAKAYATSVSRPGGA